MSALARRLLAAVAALAAATGIAQLAVHAALFARRVPFGLDLEWMEGGMLVHAQRLAGGQTIYPPPSVDFVPYLYTPLYPALLAVISKVVGLSYALGRGVSVAAFAFACAAVVALTARQAPADDRAARWRAIGVGLAGAGALAGSFRFTGAFYDLVRSDSLLLALEMGALWLAYERRSLASAAACGVVIVLGFLTKQTASVFGIGLGIGLLVAAWRRGVVYGATAAVLLAASVGGLSALTGGWFWTYVFKVHQGHDVRWDAFWKTPGLLLAHEPFVFVALATAVSLLAAARRLERRDAVLLAGAAAGFIAACVGYGTQWAFENAFIPGVAFPIAAATVPVGRLAAAPAVEGATSRVALAGTLVAALLVAAQPIRTGFPDRELLAPSARDREAGARLIQTIRDLPGEVYVPFHPYYAVLAGKRPFVHRMGVMDVGRAGLGRPAGLDEGFASQRWSHIVLDWKSQPGEWPLLDARYHQIRTLRPGEDTVRSFSGADTWPTAIWSAKPAP